MRVVVLMSTYQGELFVEEQIASILSQLPPQGLLMIRDDGSTDRTTDLLRAQADPRVSFVRGNNIGFARSFFDLLSKVPEDFDIVMLSDQDDVWLPEKIDRAWRALEAERQHPVLYFSRLTLVDEKLRPLGTSPIWPRGPSFANALVENIVTGCTIAMNRPAVALVRSTGDERRIYFHDWWIYLVVSAFGRVVMDPVPTILYRQHGNNVIGRGLGIRRYLANIAFVRKRSWVHIMFNLLANFREVHGARLAPWQRAMLARRFDPQRLSSVLRLLFAPARHRQFLHDEFLMRALLLLEIITGRGLLPRQNKP